MAVLFQDANQLPAAAGERRYWQGLQGAASTLALCEAVLHGDSLLVVITPDSEQASRLEAEARFFLAGHPEVDVLSFPDWETLPYDAFSPHQDIISERLRTLARLPLVHKGLLVTPVRTLMHRLAPLEYISAYSLLLEKGQQFDPEAMRMRLQACGYHAVGTVYEHGEFAVRGSLFDVFPMGSELPFRIDLFDNEIDTLRTFDPDTQRTCEEVPRIQLLPARELPLDEESVSLFRQAFRTTFDVDTRRCPVYQDVSAGLTSPGLEYYLPLFFPHTVTLFDYLPATARLALPADLQSAADAFWKDACERYDNYRIDRERPLLEPRAVFLHPDELHAGIKRSPVLVLSEAGKSAAQGGVSFTSDTPPALPVDVRATHPLGALQAYLADNPRRILFAAESAGRRESLLEILQPLKLDLQHCEDWDDFTARTHQHAILVADLEAGLVLPEAGLELICESQLFGERVAQARRRETRQDQSEFVVRNLAELREGAPVVHIDHGVGRYRGLHSMQIDGQDTEFLCIEYAEESKLYVPVADLHLVSRYAGLEEESAPLHRLGSEQWSKARRKAAEKIRDTAAELLELYATRQTRKGTPYPVPELEYRAFAAGFPFEETPDQQAAIRAVISDLESAQPMDRLVCGDVGFGKTEVAIRAAFVAVHNNKQVVLLVPTTLLAEQHYQSFRDRFAGLPVQIDVVSRFRTTKEQTEIVERARVGKVDILIGTHRLLQNDIKYQRLGLIIIDEEHRFGVRQKEKLKALRAETDILTLTATPIPRTLNMSLSGMRDLSIIATPPARRLSIKTFVRQRQVPLIREAVLRELVRGGQVFYLHNEVKSIERMAKELGSLLPEARITIAHGQMPERELEKVMSDFYHKRFNILLCTTIIENGIDIPNANTIIIERADRFGLAQLHQLRGRVGRSHHQAYAYLLTPHPKAMTGDAVKRLEAIASAEELGAGFTLASHDMEIRGAGELLGEEQSGQIETIGMTLYLEMLERTVEAMRSGEQPDLEHPVSGHCQTNLRIPALLPDAYAPDVHERLMLYKRVAGARDETELRDLRSELIDRFGALPPPARNLFLVASLKLRADRAGIARIDVGARGGWLEFASSTRVEPLRLVQLVQARSAEFQLRSGNQLHFRAELENIDERMKYLERLFADLLPQSPADAA